MPNITSQNKWKKDGRMERCSRPVISIITPTFNRRLSLQRAIESVQRQTCGAYEHVIVDDCSTDQTADFVGGLNDPRIVYIRGEYWQGANIARNIGIAAARSNLVTFLDSDDEFLADRVEKTIRFFEESPAAQLHLSSFRVLKRGRLRDAINPTRFLNGKRLEEVLMAYRVFIAGSSITVRRAVLEKAGGFHPNIRRMQDRELLLRLSRYCGGALSAEVDWIKHPSLDSISRPRQGYLESLNALLEVHADLAAEYRDVIGYQIARYLLTDVIRGRWWFAYKSLRVNSQASALRFRVADLVHLYRTSCRPALSS